MAARPTFMFIALICFVRNSQPCGYSFFETEAQVTFLRGHRRMLLNGCAGPELRNAVDIAIKGQDVPTITSEAFFNITTLESVTIETCKVYHISNNAFANVPNLRTIKIIGNRLNIIKQRTFADSPVEEIVLTDNQLINMIDSAFRGSKNIRIAKFDQNYLSHFYAEWFKDSKLSIQEIDLSYNNFTYFNKRSFTEFKNLKKLQCSHNYLKKLHPGTFAGLGGIQMLDLSFNHLEELPAAVTEPFSISRLEILLHNNWLNYISKQTLLNVQYGKVHLQSNPWKCPCYNMLLHWIWDSKINVVFKSKCENDKHYPVCVSEESDTHVCNEAVDHNLTLLYYTNYKKVPCEEHLI